MPESAINRLKYAVKKVKSRFKNAGEEYEKTRPEADRMMDEKYPQGWQNEKTNTLMRGEHSAMMKAIYKKKK